MFFRKCPKGFEKSPYIWSMIILLCTVFGLSYNGLRKEVEAWHDLHHEVVPNISKEERTFERYPELEQMRERLQLLERQNAVLRDELIHCTPYTPRGR